MEFDAHILKDGMASPVHQSLNDHCRHTAAYAGACLRCIGLENAAYLAGLLHDAGKYKKEFQDYLADENGIRGTVNHSFAGCRMLLELFHGERAESFQDTTAEILAYAVGAHHGLFDCMNQNETLGFDHILQKKKIYYEESRENFLACCANLQELRKLFSEACKELDPVYDKLLQTAESEPDTGGEQLMFSLGQLARLILSAVMEGDRRDTAEFMNRLPYRELRPIDLHF